MKKLNFILPLSLCFFLLQFSDLSAQFSVGLKAGYVRAWEDYGDVPLPEDAIVNVDGFQMSGMAYFEINKNISVGIEPGYVQRGAACVPGFTNFVSDTKFFLDYVELPLMFEGKLPIFKNKIEIFGKVGYGVSKIISAHQEFLMTGSEEPPVRVDMMENDIFSSWGLKKWDHGMHTGLGLSVKLGQNNLQLEANKYFAMIDVDFNNPSKNRSLQLNLGYLISL